MSDTAVAPARPKRHYGDYSDADRAAALARLEANGNNVERTSQETGVPRKTLRRWRAGHLRPAKRYALSRLMPRARDDQATIFEKGARVLALGSLEADDLSGYQKGVLSAIFTEKMLLLRGQPTHIHGSADGPLRDYTPEQMRVLADALERVARLQADTVTAPNLAAGDNGLSLDGAPSTDTPPSPAPAGADPSPPSTPDATD